MKLKKAIAVLSAVTMLGSSAPLCISAEETTEHFYFSDDFAPFAIEDFMDVSDPEEYAFGVSPENPLEDLSPHDLFYYNYDYYNEDGTFYADKQLYIFYHNNETGEYVALSEPVNVLVAMKGDVSLDGKVNAADASYILYYAANYGVGNEYNFSDYANISEEGTVSGEILEKVSRKSADVNQDGKINPYDALQVLNYAASIGAGGSGSFNQADFTQSDKTVNISIDQVSVTMNELQQKNYQIPVWISLENNPGISAFEFGIEVDSQLSYKVVSSQYEYERYYNNSEDSAVSWSGFSPSFATNESKTWLTGATLWGGKYGRLALIIAQVPENAQPGVQYDIRYLDNTHIPSEPSFGNSDTLYNVNATDGWILIEGEPDPDVPDSTENPTEQKTENIHVAIDQKNVTVDELKEMNYTVPVFVRLTENPGFNSMEMAVIVDSRCNYSLYGSYFRDDFPEGETPLIISATSDSRENFTLFAWVSMEKVTETGNLALLYVKVPESAKNGDQYDIQYSTTSPANPNWKHLWSAFDETGTSRYTDTDNVTWEDGYIRIGEAEPSDPEVMPGDASSDGKVNILDVIAVNKAVLGKDTLSETQLKAVDFNQNGKPDSEESLTILKYIVGLITSFTE